MAPSPRSQSNDVKSIQRHISNRLHPSLITEKNIVGIIGDGPSQYSKSPAMWNAAFDQLGLKAIYLPFDVNEYQLEALVAALKSCDSVLGCNVTVPYKRKVMEFLDALDPDAQRIQAVNTIARTADGRLIGYNTDGEGFIDSILTAQPGNPKSFFRSLKGCDVLLLGAGGSARAVAFHICDLLQGGQLVIANRTFQQAQSLASELEEAGARAEAISEEEIAIAAVKVDMIINSTTKGQGGIRKLADGRVTNLEPYSALAPAHPPVLTEFDSARLDLPTKWLEAAQVDIEANNRASMELAKSIPRDVAFCDLIYHPEETIFLRHARTTGHQTLNGKGMIVCQAVIGFCRIICHQELNGRNMDTDVTKRRVAEIMYEAW